MFGQSSSSSSSSAAVVAPTWGRSTNCSCSSWSPALPLNSFIPSPFSPSSLSSFFPAHLAQQCSSASSCCSHATTVSISPLIQPIGNRPRPRRTTERIGKRTTSFPSSLSSGVIRLSSLASLASAIQAFSDSGKGFFAGRDGDREQGEQEVHPGDDIVAAGEQQLLPGIVTATLAAADSSLGRGIACFSQQWPRRLDGLRRHQIGPGAMAADARVAAKQRRGIDSLKAKAPKGSGAKDTTEKNETTRRTTEVSKAKTKAIQTSQHLLAGAIAAMVSRTIVAPLERLKLEYLVRGAQGSVAKTVQRILKNEGLGGFWKGNGVNLVRTAPFKSVNFFCYDMYRNHLLKFGDRKEVTNVERLAAGAAAGVTATILCFPLDTIRTTMVAPGGEALGGMIGCFNHMVRTEGFLSLYKGLLPAVVSMAPSGAVFYGVYDMLKIAYLNSSEGKQMLQARRKRMKEAKDRGEEAWVQPELGPVRTLLFGAIAGACAESVTYPFEVIRRAQQLQHSAVKLGMARTCQMLLKKGGSKALYAGLFPSTLQVLPSAAFSYFVYETMKIAFKIP